jgi:hypothetical protein
LFSVLVSLITFVTLFAFQTFRKTLMSVFREKLNLDVVFFETAMYLWKFPQYGTGVYICASGDR